LWWELLLVAYPVLQFWPSADPKNCSRSSGVVVTVLGRRAIEGEISEEEEGEEGAGIGEEAAADEEHE